MCWSHWYKILGRTFVLSRRWGRATSTSSHVRVEFMFELDAWRWMAGARRVVVNARRAASGCGLGSAARAFDEQMRAKVTSLHGLRCRFDSGKGSDRTGVFGRRSPLGGNADGAVRGVGDMMGRTKWRRLQAAQGNWRRIEKEAG